MKKKLIAWSAAASIVAIFIALLWGTYHSRLICLKCGAFLRKSDCWMPMTSIRLFSTSHEEASAVSKALTESRWVADHEHEWKFASGAGNGKGCTLGEASSLVTLMNSEECVRMIHACSRWGDKQVQKVITALLLDPNQKFEVYSVACDIPPDGFADKASFDSWLAKLRSSVPDSY